MGYNEWKSGYDKSMRGVDQGVDGLLSNEAGRANGFGGSHDRGHQNDMEHELVVYVEEGETPEAVSPAVGAAAMPETVRVV